MTGPIKEYSKLHSNDASLAENFGTGYLVSLLHLTFNRMVNEHMRPLGLTSKQWVPIVLIGYGKAKTASEIARLTDVDSGAITRTLDRLESKGYLVRIPCARDKRVTQLELTEKGKEVIQFLAPVTSKVRDHHLAGFTDQEAQQLNHYLMRMLINSHQYYSDGTALELATLHLR